MNFTYSSYRNMIGLLKNNGYEIVDYHHDEREGKCAILRHDIDYSISKALKLAELEEQLSVRSTYFVLLSSGFYNCMERKNIDAINEIRSMGHEIGLHFDEAQYNCNSVDDIRKNAEKEKKIFEEIVGFSISSISMHRPSKLTLENDIQFPDMINSYGNKFMEEFKYVSDSRMHWRENVEEIISNAKCERIHILTHAFWYEDSEVSTKDILLKFINGSNLECYRRMNGNLKNLSEFMRENEVV